MKESCLTQLHPMLSLVLNLTLDMDIIDTKKKVSDGSSSDAYVLSQAFPGGASDKQSACQCRRHRMRI